MEKLVDVLFSSKVVGSFVVVLVSIILFMILKEITLKYINNKKKSADKRKKKRLTILYITVSSLKYVIFLMDVIIILGIFDIDVSAFLAGLGLFGIVVGLALQDLLKDFIAGIFIILDSQYSVGDHVQIDGFIGEVSGVGLKSTKVRDYEGNIRIFNNREVSDVVNLSVGSSKVIATFTFNSDENLVELEKAMDELTKRCKKVLEDATNELQYKGVEAYGDGKLTLKLTVDVKPTKQFSTLNKINREAKLLFDERGIKIK